MRQFILIGLSLCLVLIHSIHAIEDIINSEEESLIREIQDKKLSKKDIKELLPMVLDEILPSNLFHEKEHHRSKRFIIKKKIIIGKLLLLKKLLLLSTKKGGQQQKGQQQKGGYAPSPSYGPPPAPSYGPPPAPSYGPPPAPSYGPPSSGYSG